MKHRRTFRRYALCIALAAVGLFAAPACSSGPAPEEDDRDQFIGRPPPPEKDDPFFAHALPAEAVPAEPSGRIGDRPPAPPEPAEPEPEPEPVELEPEPEPVEPEPEELAALDEPDRPERPERPVEDPPEIIDEKASCFSCVRICPVNDDGSTHCSDADDDLICGWGSHDDAEEAKKTARAHCDATLDMARQMPNYSEISGTCPPATCQ